MSWLAALDRLEPDLVVNTGDSIAHPKAVHQGRTASGWAIESPVFTTRSGSSRSRPASQDMRRVRLGVRCTSEMCRTRMARAGASTGTSAWRSVNQLRSTTDA